MYYIKGHQEVPLTKIKKRVLNAADHDTIKCMKDRLGKGRYSISSYRGGFDNKSLTAFFSEKGAQTTSEERRVLRQMIKYYSNAQQWAFENNEMQSQQLVLQHRYITFSSFSI